MDWEANSCCVQLGGEKGAWKGNYLTSPWDRGYHIPTAVGEWAERQGTQLEKTFRCSPHLWECILNLKHTIRKRRLGSTDGDGVSLEEPGSSLHSCFTTTGLFYQSFSKHAQTLEWQPRLLLSKCPSIKWFCLHFCFLKETGTPVTLFNLERTEGQRESASEPFQTKQLSLTAHVC